MNLDASQNSYTPWVSIWLNPRATIRQIVATDPTRFVIMLAMLRGVVSAFDRLSGKNVGDHLALNTILSIILVIGPIVGVVNLYIGAALLRWTGRWIGGSATSEHLRAALAWGNVPAACGLLLWIPMLAIMGHEMFTTETPTIDSSPLLLGLFIGLALIGIVFSVWSVVISLKCVGEVQGFSAWRALGNALLAGLVIFIPIALIGVLILVLLYVLGGK